MENEQKFYVYVDFRGDDGKPFYVGKGSGKRVKKEKRNPLHTNIKNKHGIIREVVFETNSEQESFEKEIQLIGELQTHIDHGNGGANFTLGGEGISGYKFTEEQREKSSELNKKLWEDPEIRAMIKEKQRLGWEDPEIRKNQSEKIKKIWEDPERRKKLSESVKKKCKDPDHKEKMKKVYEDPKFKAKLSESQKKLWEDPEFKAMMKEKIKLGMKKKKQWEDPEFRENHSEKLKKKWEDPEFRAMMKEKIKLGMQKKKLEKLQQES